MGRGILMGVIIAAVFALGLYLKINRAVSRLHSGTPFGHRSSSVSVASFPAELKGKSVDEIVAARAPVTFAERHEAKEVEPGVMCSELTVHSRGPGGKTTLWLYAPKEAHAKGELPCVLIAPAGTHMVEGMDLGDGDRPEHLPYVRAGFAVLAYSLDGEPEEDDDEGALANGARQFHAAGAGLVNFEVAMDYLQQRAPEVDPRRVYVAGHSSAATMALVAAGHDGRVAGCVAYAPCVDTAAHYAKYLRRRAFDDMVPEENDLMREISPAAHAEAVRCPTMIFIARDDHVIDTVAAESFGRKLAARDPRCKVFTVPSGGHFDSMIDRGIPAGITYLRDVCGAFGKKGTGTPATKP